jgi:hypothetical protein
MSLLAGPTILEPHQKVGNHCSKVFVGFLQQTGCAEIYQALLLTNDKHSVTH